MADFKTALEALATGKLSIDILCQQLEKLLQDNPKFATRILAQLDDAHEQDKLENQHYVALKRRINEYRRGHAAETETEEGEGGDATVFEAGDRATAQTGSAPPEVESEESTIIRDKGDSGAAVESEESTVIRDRGEGGAVESEESTVIRDRGDGGAVESEESTVIRDRGEGGEEAATFIQEKPVTDDATQVMEEGPATATAGTGIDFDISMPGTDTDGISSVTGGTGPSGTEWQQPQQTGGYVPGQEFGPGDIIKQRFKLLKVLGIGGMGKVYMATDLLKEEARDKKPNVAIKLLNDDFKDHPEAFISLQRESSRQQKLAHPNIATIYDFDRVGGPGTPVFITMELMEGMELKDFIKKKVRKQGGLPFDEAYEIIKQLGAGLIYAHNRNLVHSDFKPGNAFLCNDGVVKTLDFGIARAVKNPVTGEAEKTLFDPGKLGALTPAYASLEMLEGEEPDTRDDTYALGCVAYELLTGKHPFNKLPATTARDNGLIPAPIKGLNKKQNRALRRAVAFRREDRSPSVEHFLEELEGKPTWHKNPFVIAAGILILIGLMLINPALDYLHNKEIEGIIADINSGSNEVIVAKLDEIRTMEKADQTRITDEAKDAIQRYYSSQIARQIDITGENYNFPVANGILDEVAGLYPESLFLQEQTDQISFNKKQKEADLYNDYIAALDPTAAVQDPTIIDSTKKILNIIRQRIDPNHPLLTDPRPSNAYRLAAEQSFADNNLEQALSLVTSGLQNAPKDVRLQDLKNKVETRIEIAKLNDSLGTAQEQLTSLADYKQYQTDIVRLANLSTPQESPVLETLSSKLKQTVSAELDRITKQGTRADAESMATEYGELLSSLLLGRELTQIKLSHLSGDARTQAIQELVSTDKSVIEERMTTPNIDDTQWESSLLASVRELATLADEDKSIAGDLQSYRENIAQLYIDKANETMKANRFDAADGYINRAERMAPELAMLQDTRSQIAASKTAYEKQQRINDLKEQFKFQTEADRVAEAQDLFDKLKAELPEDDPYIATRAPSILADSYARLAQRRAESSEFESALQLAEAGLALAPRNAVLKGIRDEYRVEVNMVELAGLFKSARIFSPSEVVDIARKVNQIEQGAPAKYPDFRKESETVLAEQINFLAQTDENSAAALADAALTIFPTSSILADLKDQFQLEPWPGSDAADAVVSTGELTRARSLLEEAVAGEFAGHPQVLEFQKTLEEKMKQAGTAYDVYVSARDAAGEDYSKLRQAKKLLGRAQSVWLDNPDYDAAEIDIDNRIANAPDNPAKKVLAREQPTDFSATSEDALARAQEEWNPVSSGRECNPRLAGYGARARAVCFDLVNTGWRGPLMVVVPSSEEHEKSYAIGKYELSIGDWSKYCALSGKCKPETDKEKFDDPVTGISLADAQAYVEWLSERTGKTYRLPTKEEWEYAANAAGKQPQKDVNCRLELGDKVLKGTGIVSVKSGRSNGWGLKNYVGNVQEWTVDDSGATTAVGGAFSDAHSKCDITLQRPHDGHADNTTGFRVVLEDVG